MHTDTCALYIHMYAYTHAHIHVLTYTYIQSIKPLTDDGQICAVKLPRCTSARVHTPIFLRHVREDEHFLHDQQHPIVAAAQPLPRLHHHPIVLPPSDVGKLLVVGKAVESGIASDYNTFTLGQHLGRC